jgi:hypothetical protein
MLSSGNAGKLKFSVRFKYRKHLNINTREHENRWISQTKCEAVCNSIWQNICNLNCRCTSMLFGIGWHGCANALFMTVKHGIALWLTCHVAQGPDRVRAHRVVAIPWGLQTCSVRALLGYKLSEMKHSWLPSKCTQANNVVLSRNTPSSPRPLTD